MCVQSRVGVCARLRGLSSRLVRTFSVENKDCAEASGAIYGTTGLVGQFILSALRCVVST